MQGNHSILTKIWYPQQKENHCYDDIAISEILWLPELFGTWITQTKNNILYQETVF